MISVHLKQFKEIGKRRGITLTVFFLIIGCTEDVDLSNRYVFKEDTVMSYLMSHSESYSTYTSFLYKVPVSSLSNTTVGQLLSARGHYTVFAPTNKAIESYLDTLVAENVISYPSWEAFTDSTKLDSVRKVIVYNSIIDSGDTDEPIHTYDFPTIPGGEILIANMNDRKMPVYFGNMSDSISIFGKYLINSRNRDIIVLNGVIHQMESVIAPKSVTAADYLQDIIDNQREGFLIMARAIMACGLSDTLNVIRDETYETKYQLGEIPDVRSNRDIIGDNVTLYAPQHRLYGFTIFAETDDFWQ